MVVRNKALLLETLRKIQEDPKSWNQRHWVNSCGTAFCFAGHAAVLSGAEAPTKPGADNRPWYIQSDGTLDPVSHLSWAKWVSDVQSARSDPYSVSVSDWAARNLGVHPDEAEWLFDATNNMEYLEAAVHALVTDGHLDAATGNVVNADGDVVYYREEADVV